MTTTTDLIKFTAGANFGNIQIGGEYGDGYTVATKTLSVADIGFNLTISFSAVSGGYNPATPPNITGSWTGSYRGVCME